MKTWKLHLIWAVITVVSVVIAVVATTYILTRTVRTQVVYSPVLCDVPEEGLYHIGNYDADTILILEQAAQEMVVPCSIGEPYSYSCSQPEANCTWDEGWKSFHVERSALPEFWGAYCRLDPQSLVCQ